MAIASFETHLDKTWCYISGTASANADATDVVPLVFPLSTFAVLGSRAANGNFTFTLQGSLDGETFTTLGTCTVTGGTANYQYSTGKPMRYVKVVFTDVDSTTVKFRIVGVG